MPNRERGRTVCVRRSALSVGANDGHHNQPIAESYRMVKCDWLRSVNA
jgi:hypothetical protein